MEFTAHTAFPLNFFTEKENSHLKLPPRVINVDKIIDVYFVSDLHTDGEKNVHWVDQKCVPKPSSKENYNVIIVAGDIASSLAQIELTFKFLTRSFNLVCFVPGNHEAWCTPPSQNSVIKCDLPVEHNSLQKLDAVLYLAVKYNICVCPIKIRSVVSNRSIFIIPLHAWYHSGFDKERDVTMTSHDDTFIDRWGDFSLCKWPSWLMKGGLTNMDENNENLSKFFAYYNNHIIKHFKRCTDAIPTMGDQANEFFAIDSTDYVVSYSHYLPFQELMPEKRYLFEPNLMKVIGSDQLLQQVEALSPNMHLFGHTHIPIDITTRNIRCIQWPLGYTREAAQQCKIVVEHGPMIVWSSCAGDGGLERLYSEECKWAVHYRENARNPQNIQLAQWVVDFRASKASLYK